jgi:hypothetical protein
LSLLLLLLLLLLLSAVGRALSEVLGQAPVVYVSTPAQRASHAFAKLRRLSWLHTGMNILAHAHFGLLLLPLLPPCCGVGAGELLVVLVLRPSHSPEYATSTPLQRAVQLLPCVTPSLPHTGSHCIVHTQLGLTCLVPACSRDLLLPSLLLLLLVCMLLQASAAQAPRGGTAGASAGRQECQHRAGSCEARAATSLMPAG